MTETGFSDHRVELLCQGIGRIPRPVARSEARKVDYQPRQPEFRGADRDRTLPSPGSSSVKAATEPVADTLSDRTRDFCFQTNVAAATLP
jgi:hypothetical protein